MMRKRSNIQHWLTFVVARPDIETHLSRKSRLSSWKEIPYRPNSSVAIVAIPFLNLFIYFLFIYSFIPFLFIDLLFICFYLFIHLFIILFIYSWIYLLNEKGQNEIWTNDRNLFHFVLFPSNFLPIFFFRRRNTSFWFLLVITRAKRRRLTLPDTWTVREHNSSEKIAILRRTQHACFGSMFFCVFHATQTRSLIGM